MKTLIEILCGVGAMTLSVAVVQFIIKNLFDEPYVFDSFTVGFWAGAFLIIGNNIAKNFFNKSNQNKDDYKV